MQAIAKGMIMMRTETRGCAGPVRVVLPERKHFSLMGEEKGKSS